MGCERTDSGAFAGSQGSVGWNRPDGLGVYDLKAYTEFDCVVWVRRSNGSSSPFARSPKQQVGVEGAYLASSSAQESLIVCSQSAFMYLMNADADAICSRKFSKEMYLHTS